MKTGFRNAWTRMTGRGLVCLTVLLGATSLVGMSACSDTKTTGTTTDLTAVDDPNASACAGKFCTDTDVRYKVDPAKLKFQDVAPTAPAQVLKVRILNIGNQGILRVKNPRFDKKTTDFKEDFSTLFAPDATVADHLPRKDLDSLAYLEFNVTYQPAAAGVRTINLLFDTNTTDTTKRLLTIPIEVVAAGSGLGIQPNPVDFGAKATGSSDEIVVTLTNLGNAPLKIVGAKLDSSGSSDFTLTALPDANTPVGAGASTTLTVKYTPTLLNGAGDESLLLLETDDKRKFSAPVTGSEIAPVISVIPTKLDFGQMMVGDKVTKPMKITNKGLATLQVSEVALSPLSLQTLATSDVLIDPPAPYTLEPGKDQLVQVTLTASHALPSTGVVGSLNVVSNDQADPTVVVPMYASTATPTLQVSVNDVPCTDPTQCLANFGFVGKANPPAVLYGKRKITLVNTGSSPLEVSLVTITDDAKLEFDFDPNMTIPPADKNPTLISLDPFKPVEFNVRFENKGASGTDATATLHIKSNDGDHPDYPVNLLATRADGTSCKIELVPQPLNFGLLPYGKSKILPLLVKNVGTGSCSFSDAVLVNCYQAPGPFGGAGTKCQSSASAFYAIGPKATTLFSMAPGDSGKILINFTAPDTLGDLAGGKADTITDIQALIVLKYKDAQSGVVSNYPNVDPSNFSTIGNAKPNLLAKVGLSKVQVLPDSIDFGVVTLGCLSNPVDASIYNIGTTDVNVTKVALDNCGPEVKFVNKPAIPKAGLPVSQKTPQAFKVQYQPQKVGKLQCQLTITTGNNGMCTDTTGQTSGSCDKTSDCPNAGDLCLGDSFAVPLTGEGTLDTEYTDHFNQADGKQVDVLFVVDNSGSMSEEQQNLATSFQNFVQIASVFNDDYHIGVVTTDMDDNTQAGRLQLKGSEPYRYVTKNLNNPGSMLEKKTDQGTNGSSTEQGFAAVEAALTLPLTLDSKKTCKADSDCTKGEVCTTDPATGAQGCGGENRGFLRKYADLEVVVMSDENDQSPSSLSYYQNKFLSLKGAANKNLVHVHAITGLSGGCTGSGGQAEDCGRYVDMANYFGGVAASICDLNFAPVLQNIGTQAFGLALEYFLTRTPEPSTISVKVSGVDCPPGPNSWTYDSAANAVVFNDKGTCVPQKNDTIDIHYSMLCIK